MTELSGYRLMWMFAMFDLPVVTKQQRKDATGFRNYLLKKGFHMLQLSVYAKHCRDRDQAELLAIGISQAVPQDGKLDLLYITDKQYENIVTFYGEHQIHRKNPDALTLF